MRNSLVVVCLGLVAWALAACGTNAAPNNAPIQAGPQATAVNTLEPPPYQQPISPITAENANRVQYIGRLDTNNSVKSSIFSHSFSPDGTRLAALDNNLLLAWDLADGSIIFSRERSGDVRVFYSPDKTEIYTVDNEGTISIYNENGILQNTLEGNVGFTGAYAYHADQALLALGNDTGSVKLWDLTQRTALTTFAANDSPSAALAFSDDSMLLATVGLNGHAKIWDWQQRQQIADFDHEGASVSDVIFSGDGGHIATATPTYIAVWSIEDNELDYALELEEAGASGIFTYSPDGARLITAGRNAPLIIWDATTGEQIGQLPNVSGNRMSVAFSPDSELMVTSVLDQDVTLWNLAHAAEETIPGAVLEVGSSRITDVAWTDDGFIMAFFDADGTVYLWGISQ